MGVGMAGVSDLNAGYECRRNGVTYHNLVYTVHGSARLEHVSGARRLRAGDLLIAPAGSCYTYVPDQEPWVIAWFLSAPNARWDYIDGMTAHIRRTELAGRVHTAALSLLAESVRKEMHSGRLSHLYAEEIALCLERDLGTEGSRRERGLRRRLGRLWDAVNEDLAHPWTVDEMARRASLSRSHFHRVVRRYSGHAPMEMVHLLRMRRAEELLLHDGQPLKVVAERLGFATPYAFSNAFKRYKGLSPSRFRSAPGR
jgi:AraC-like DNA-binding protein